MPTPESDDMHPTDEQRLKARFQRVDGSLDTDRLIEEFCRLEGKHYRLSSRFYAVEESFNEVLTVIVGNPKLGITGMVEIVRRSEKIQWIGWGCFSAYVIAKEIGFL